MKKRMKKALCSVLALAMLLSGTNLAFAQDGVLPAPAVNGGETPKILRTLYDSPAEDSIEGWKTESIPIGNGYMGVNIFGGVEYDRLQITEQSMYTSPTSYINNRYTGGQESFADLYLDTEHSFADVQDYSRQLCLNNAVASMQYTADGVQYTREYFASYPDKVTVVKLAADQAGALDFTVRPVIAYERDQLDAPGVKPNSGKHGTVVAEGDTITLSGNSEYYNIDFEAQFKVILKDGAGSIRAENGTDEEGNPDNGKLVVTGAQEAYVIFAVGTNYEMTEQVFTDSVENKLKDNPHPHEKVTGYLTDAAAKDYATLLSTHTADWEKYFNSAVFDIGGVDDGRTTPELIDSYQAGTEEKYLEELYFQMGRYMMIASSREGTLPPGLQAIWNAYDIAPWSAGYWYNVNQQMNYWPIFSTNLGELYKSYSDFNVARLPAAEINGSNYIRSYRPDQYEDEVGRNGWIVGVGNSAYNVSGVSAGGNSGPGTGGFTAISDIDYYRFTKDPSVLVATYPILESLARFYAKSVDNYDGSYLSTISASPEQVVDGKSYQTIGCAFDQQMIYETNKAVIDIYDEYKDILNNPDVELINTLKEQINNYDPVLVGFSGQVKEYREENYYGEYGEKNHRHISQLVGLYPGTSINDETPAWVDAAKVTLKNRGLDTGTGWSVAHKLGMWARTGDGETSYQLVQAMIKLHLFDNLWNSHDNSSQSSSVFQADGNFGGTAGIAEMLLQSHGEYIKVLPAIPAAWGSGSYQGLVARGNFEVSADWTNQHADKITVTSNAGGTLKLSYYNISDANITDESGAPVSFTSRDKDSVEIETTEGQVIVIDQIPAYSITSNISDVKVEAQGKGASITWNASPDSGATYNVYRALDSEPVYELLAEGISETSYTDTQRDGSQATYKVTAIAGTSEESAGETATIIPMAAEVTEITAFMVDDTNLQIQWTPSVRVQTYKVYEKNSGQYTLLFETEDNICVIEGADPGKTYAISSVYFENESEKTDVVIGEQGDNVSKLELSRYMTQINALTQMGYEQSVIDSFSADIDAVKAIWRKETATAAEVADAVRQAQQLLDEISYFTYNVALKKPVEIDPKITGHGNDYRLEFINDGSYDTRYATSGSTAATIFQFTVDLQELCDVASMEVVDFCDGSSRGDKVTFEGLLSNGQWVVMQTVEDITGYPHPSNMRTVSVNNGISLPVSKIRVTLENTDSFIKDMSVWEFRAIGSKHDSRPKILSLGVNEEKPAVSDQKYELVENVDNGMMLYSDRDTYAIYHLGSALKGLTQIKLPINDSTRANNDALNAFMQGNNTYLRFSANSDGKVYVVFHAELPYFTEEAGWKLVSSSAPPVPEEYETINVVPMDYNFEGYPYYMTRAQWQNTPDVIDYAGQRGYAYEKSFSAYEMVEIPTPGFLSDQNYFVAYTLTGENTSTALDYIFYNDEAVQMEDGKYDYTISVDPSIETITLDALAKNTEAKITKSAETLQFDASGTAHATITVELNGQSSTYNLTFKRKVVLNVTNVALNKPVTVDPPSWENAGGFGSFSDAAIVDGIYANDKGRYYSSAKNNIVATIDLQGEYMISYIDVAELRNSEPMRTDNFTIEAYVGGEWVTKVTGEPLDGKIESGNSADWSKTRFEFDEPFAASQLRFTFKNSAIENGETAVQGPYKHKWYPIAGTADCDISIMEIEVYALADDGGPAVVVHPENEAYSADVLTDGSADTFYETAAVDFSADPAYVTVKTMAYENIKKILLTPRKYADGEEYYYDRPTSYTVSTSLDNKNFTPIKSGEIVYADYNDYDVKTIELDEAVTAPYIKIEFGSVFGSRGDGNQYLSLAEIAFMPKEADPDEPLDGMQFYNIRDGFSNSYLKFNAGGEATVAFLGGSITDSTGWRTNMQTYLREKFPQTNFTFINAGIPSTDSTLGAFRVQKDVLAKGNVDLLFVEFAVNDEDNKRSETESIKGMEGILRQAYSANPYMDICVLHFSDPNKHDQYNTNEDHHMPVIDAQEKAVSHYNVTSLDLAKEVSARIAHGELTWEEFGGKHPSALGHKIYSDGIIRVLESSWETASGSQTAKALPGLLNEHSYTSARYEDIAQANLINGFQYVENWEPTDGVETRKGFVNVPMLESSEIGAQLTYTFTGTDIGILLPAGPDIGDILYSVDGGEEKTRSLYTSWSGSLHIPFVFMLETELEYGEHTITITAAETKNQNSKGNAVRIQSFLVNGSAPSLTVDSLKERDLFQRNDNNEATIAVTGSFDAGKADSVTVSATRMDGYSAGADIGETAAQITGNTFQSSLTLKGGYYKVTVTAKLNETPVDVCEINKVGVGEIFITAGEGNSVSMASTKAATTPADDRVVSYDYANETWVFAKDPQVSLGEFEEYTSWGNKTGETRGGGSPWPQVGDLLTAQLDVPVGFINVGWAATLVSNWTSEQGRYGRINKAVTKFGANGVRAILWHQGESDSRNGTTTEAYQTALQTIISKSREDAGWEIPWVVAIVGYNNRAEATEERQEAIRQAQRQTIAQTENVYEGPYTDDLVGSENRDGTGIYFTSAGLTAYATRWAAAITTAFFDKAYEEITALSINTPENLTQTYDNMQPVDFQVTTEPTDNVDTGRIEWYVNDMLQDTKGLAFRFTPDAAGEYHVYAKVADTSVVSQTRIITVTPPDPDEPSYKIQFSATGAGTISYSGPDGTADLGSGGEKTLAQGSDVTVTANAAAGTEFLYWVRVDTGRIVSKEAAYSFTVGSAAQLAAVFGGTDGQNLAVFTSGRNGQVIQSGYTAGSVLVPDAPYVMGYTFTGWLRDRVPQKFNSGDSIEVTGDVVYEAWYEQKATTYTITVENGTGSGEYKFNDEVTAVANTAPSGQKFSHWTKDGAVVSYDATYTFYASGAATVTAVYVGEGETVNAEPVLVASAAPLAEDSRIAFFSERDLPDEWEVIETGLLLSEEADFDLDTAAIKAASTSTEKKGQYTVRKAGVQSGEQWYGRAYVVYRVNGETKVLYSDVVSATL